MGSTVHQHESVVMITQARLEVIIKHWMSEVSLLEHTTIVEVQQDVIATELCLTGAV